MQVVDLKEARASGLKRFFNGNPCPKGHVAERFVSSRGCVVCTRERLKANPDLQREYHRRSNKKRRELFPDKAREEVRLANKRRYWADVEVSRKQNREKAKRLNLQRNIEFAGREKPELCDSCGRKSHLVFDHCHSTGKFRGWICHPCNKALGFVEDSVERLNLLRAYLEKNHVEANK